MQIEFDFIHLYPDKTINLFKKFDVFKNQLQKYINRHKRIHFGPEGSEMQNAQLINLITPGKYSLLLDITYFRFYI